MLSFIVTLLFRSAEGAGVALCVSGGFRTLALDSVSLALRRDMADPLRADVFIFADVRSLDTRAHCRQPPREEPLRDSVARSIGDDDFVATLRRTMANVRPTAVRLTGCDRRLRANASSWCLAVGEEKDLYSKAAGPCVREEEVKTTSYAHGYHQWVLMAACFSLMEDFEKKTENRYDFLARWRPDAVWKVGPVVLDFGKLDAWRLEHVLLGNHITRYCPAETSPDCDLINDVFAVATRPKVAEAYFRGTYEIFRDEACFLSNYTELSRAAGFECKKDRQYPECKMATSVRRVGGDIPHLCTPLKSRYIPTDENLRLGCPFEGAGGPRGPPWGLRRWQC